MPFNRPTIPEILARVKSDFESRLPGADAALRNRVLNVFAFAIAGVAHHQYGYLDWISRQIMPDTAEAEHLERWSKFWFIDRKVATKATGNVTFTGTNGTLVPEGLVLQRSDGAQFVTDDTAAISAGSVSLSVIASLAGVAGNSGTGETLTIITTVAGITSQATVDSPGLSGGADTESDDDLRSRLTAQRQLPPHGGAAHDYEAWALEVPGVTRAWVYPLEGGDGKVTVRFVRDDDASIIPDASEVQAVQDYIDALRPVTAILTVAAPTAVALDLTIQLTPDTAEVRAAVQAEIEDMLARDASPAGTIYLSRIREAISSAAGETNHVLTLPAADVTHTTGQLAVMGTITWT